MKFAITRRHFLAGAILTGAAALGDLWLIEPRWVKTTRVKVGLKNKSLARPIRILHLSDLHASDKVPIAFLRKAIELGLSCKPDLVCLTGDLVNRRIPDREQYVSALSLLAEHCPSYACVGNHDGGSWVSPIGGYPSLAEMFSLLNEAGISVLFNKSQKITVQGNTVELVGLGDYWAKDARPEKAFPNRQNSDNSPRIVLSHNPDSKEILGDWAWDLMLCGHTHGGQLSLPLIGTPFAPVRDHDYVYGLNEWNGRLIYTTSGVGNLHGMRFNCRPEVALIEVS